MIGFTIVLKKYKIKNKTKQKKAGKKFLYFMPVIFIMIFSVVTAFFINNTEEKITLQNEDAISVFKEINNYSEYYLPVVINEFFSYQKGDEVENDMLVKIGVWSIISTENTAKYEVFDGELVIGKNEVGERVKMLFSDEINFKDTSVITNDYTITYDDKTESYIIPTQGFRPNYSAVLQSVATKSGKTVLTVGCLESDSFKQDSSGNTVLPEAEKVVEITLKKGEKGFYIESIL